MALVGFGAMLMLVLALPVIVAGGTAYLWRKRLSRPWWFWLTATVVLYGVYSLAMTWYPPVGGIEISMADAKHPATHESLWWMVLEPFRQGLSAFVIGAVPTAAVLVRLFRKPKQT
jgi:cytochrome bd-type quinol oxidase subunit 2